MKGGMRKAAAMGLSVLMTLGLTPASAFAVNGSQVAADGTYTASAAVETDDPDEWASYNVTASVTVAGGKIFDLTVTSSDLTDDSETYFTRAYSADTSRRKGIKTVLEGTDATYENADSSFDSVSGATIASAAMKNAVLEALSGAPEAVSEEYVLMNVPYDVFYKTVSTTADAVSKATSKVRIGDRAGASYNGSGNATNTADVTDVSKGAQIPVKVTDTTALTALGGSEVTDDTTYTFSYISHGQTVSETRTGKAALLQADDYAYYKLSETPAYYLTLNADGTFTAPADAAVTEVQGSADDIVYGGKWGDYQVNFPDEVASALYTDISKDADNAKSLASAVTITVDGSTYGLKALANIWKSSEIAWNAAGDLAATNGGTLDKVTVYTADGVYEINYGVQLNKVYTDKIAATLAAAGGTVTNLPSDISNPTVSVSYTVGSGRGAQTTYVVEKRALTDGAFEVTSADNLENGKEYTVAVSSDNYNDIKTTAVYDGSVYVLMNIPYDVFYSTVGTDADTVSGATAKVRNSGVAGSTYNGGKDAENTTDVTDKAKGVTYAVKVSDAALLTGEEVTDATSYKIAYSGRGQTTKTTVEGKAALIQADDYAYYKLDSAPASYLTLTAEGFSAPEAAAEEVQGTLENLTYGGHWGTYQVEFPSDVKGSVAAVTVTVDGKTYGLKATDNIWRSFEIAWNAEGDLAATNGGTLNYVTVYVAPKTTTEKDGTVTVDQADYKVYKINYNVALKTLSDAAITASLKDGKGTVSGSPDDLANPTVAVSYTTGSGRGAKTTKYFENVALTDGTFAIPANTLTEGTEYTVTVSSDNYIDISATAVYAVSAFKDVTDETSFLYKSVAWAADEGIALGYSDNTFRPGKAVTRGEAAAFLWRLAGKPETTLKESPFTDVNSGSAFYKAILWGYEKGIIRGYGDKTFRADQTCTRSDMMLFLWRYAGKPGTKYVSSFSDVPQTAGYAKSVNWAVNAGIATGYSDNTFGPDKTCTRGQAVQFLYRMSRNNK